MKTMTFAAAFAAGLALAAPAYAASADLEGQWDAQSPQNGGLAELDITFDGRSYQVRAAAICRPRACDLGQANGTVLVPPNGRNPARDAVGVTASFNASDANRQVIATVAGANRLSVTTIQIYRDGRPASLTTETFRRADRQPDVIADCTPVSANLRIRFQGGEWTVADGNRILARFDSPEEAGYARFLIAAQGLRQKCEISAARFEYWTLANGGFPSGAQAGESCANVSYRQISVAKSGRNWQVRAGNRTLYTTPDRAAADATAQVLIDNRVAAQCSVGEVGRGMTYFRR